MNKKKKPAPQVPEQPVPQPAPILPGDPIVTPEEPMVFPGQPHDPIEPDPEDPKALRASFEISLKPLVSGV